MDKENEYSFNAGDPLGAHNVAPPTLLNQLRSKDYEYFDDLDGFHDDMTDLPDKGKEALQDLYRFSHRLGENLRKAPEESKRSLAQGELFFRSRWLHHWRKRFGSVANHAQFGPVLFLFAYDKEGNVELKNSKMIALMDSSVRLGRNIKSHDGLFKCEFVVSTVKKRHVFAACNSIQRDYWIDHIRSLS